MKSNRLARVLALVIAAVMMVCLFAGCAAADASGDTAATGGGWSMIVMIVLMIAVFYFFLIRPENKKKKALSEMRDALAVGDEITTIGGIVGKVVHIKDDLITIETSADRVRMEFARWAISTKGTQTTNN